MTVRSFFLSYWAGGVLLCLDLLNCFLDLCRWSTGTTPVKNMHFPPEGRHCVKDGIVFLSYDHNMAFPWPKCWLGGYVPTTWAAFSACDSHAFSHPTEGSFLAVPKLKVPVQLPEIGQKTNGGRVGPCSLSLWSFITAEIPSEYLTGYSRRAALQWASVKLPLMNISV